MDDKAAASAVDRHLTRFDAGAHPGMNGNFILLEFDEADINDLVHLESVEDITINEDAQQIAGYSDRFGVIEELALSEDATIAFIDELIAEMTVEIAIVTANCL